MRPRALAVLVAALFAVGCRCEGSSPRARPASSPEAPPAPAASGTPESALLPPLHAESWRIELAVSGFGPASVSVPLGATDPRPVVIALHGHDDRPDWQCGTWRGIVDAFAFVLCPRGVPSRPESSPEQRFSWGNVADTEHEIRASLGALKQRFGRHIAPGGVVLVGYSLGAVRALNLMRGEPSFFARVALVEGGIAEWTPTLATIFARGGGRRVLFVCSQQACKGLAEHKVIVTDRAGADARLVYAGDLGHMLDGRVARQIAGQWDWLVAGDPRWRGYHERKPKTRSPPPSTTGDGAQ